MDVPFKQRIACTAKEACSAGGFGNTTLYKLISDGSLDTVTVGRRRLIKVRSLLKLLGEDQAAA